MTGRVEKKSNREHVKDMNKSLCPRKNKWQESAHSPVLEEQGQQKWWQEQASVILDKR